ncbi:MAG: hypothetical protein ACE5JH_11340 [Acidobacteriota bacterium]
MIRRYAKLSRVVPAVALVVLAASALSIHAQMMKKPEMVTLSGRIMDLTCAAKGHAMMGKWNNALNDDHMTPDGKKANCARMCLLGGQPAALFDTKKNKIEAVFACNPRATLAEYAAQDVEVMGFWATKNKEGLRTFVPQKIRNAGSGAWTEVNCATMHA